MRLIDNLLSNVFARYGYGLVKKGAEGMRLWPLHNGGSWFTKRGTDQQKLMEQMMGWVYACTSKIAEDIGSARLRLYRKTGAGPEDWEEITEHPLLDMLDRPNATQPRFELFQLWSMHEDLAGNAYWLLDGVKNDMEAPTAIYPLNPATITPKIDHMPGQPDGVVGYKFKTDNRERTLQPYEVLHFRKPNPSNGFVGLGPTEATIETIDAENWMREWNRRFFENAAIPSAILETTETSPELIRQLRESFEDRHAGVERAHKVVMLPNGVKYADKGYGQKDMDFAELRRMTRDEILAFYGVPGVVLGLGLGETINRASAETLEYVYMKHTVAPKLRRFETFLNEFLVPRFGTDIALEFDNPVPENIEMNIKLHEAALGKEPYLTANEVRAKEGLPPVEGGNTLMVSSMVVPLGKPIEQAKSKHQKKCTHKILPTKSRKTLQTADRKEKLVDAIAEGLKSGLQAAKRVDLASLAAEDWNERWKAFVARVEPEEKRMHDAMEQYAKEMGARALIQLRRKIGKSRKAKVPQLLDREDEVQAIIDAMAPIYVELLEKEGTAAAEIVGAAFDAAEERMRKALDKSINLMAKKYTDETLTKLKDRIATGLAENATPDELAESISEITEWSMTSRAETVARTEAYRTANFATKEAWKQSGVVKTIKWYTAEDERVCPFCDEMEGKIVGVEQNFADKGDTIDGTDDAGDSVSMSVEYADVEAGSLHPNCRCYVRPEEISIE